METDRITIESSFKRIRAVIGGETVADSIATQLLIEGYWSFASPMRTAAPIMTITPIQG